MGLYWFLKTNQFTNAVKPRQQSRRLTANSAKTFQALHQNNIVLDKAGPNGIALVAGIKGSLLPHCGITTHEYYLSDRLSEASTQSVAGRNKIESFRSINHEHISVGRKRASAKLPVWFRQKQAKNQKN